MRLTELTVHNYKSLREVTFRPSAFNVLVGPNDSGKSNFADALDFLSIVYRDGLNAAVARKDGFDSIIYRGKIRSRAPIRFSVQAEGGVPDDLRNSLLNSDTRIRYCHEFGFRAPGTSVREDFTVENERFSVSLIDVQGQTEILSIRRLGSEVDAAFLKEYTPLFGISGEFSETFLQSLGASAGAFELMVTVFGRILAPVRHLVGNLSRIGIFQFSPHAARSPSLSISDMQMDRHGEGLPNVIDGLQRDHPDAWDAILSVMRHIIPWLDAIRVESSTSRLFFEEEGAGRTRTVDEVSDGTIRSLMILTAIFDPNTPFLIIENPEHSLHPWIVRNIVDACRSASERKQVLLTTHSPVLLDAVLPAELWLVWRNGKGSHVERLTHVEANFEDSWKTGAFSISEFLDTGIQTKYVPAGLRYDDEYDSHPGIH